MSLFNLRTEIWSYPLIWNLIFILSWSILYFTFGERITANNGCGYDGHHYCQIAQKFEIFWQNKSFSTYYIHRILPCGIVYCLITGIGASLSLSNIIVGFYVLNTISWLLSVLLWHQIMKYLQISSRVQWLISILMLVNFYVLKFIFYYPVLTDSLAFLFGTAALWFYVQDKVKMLLLIGLLGAFVYPLFSFYIFLLIIFPISLKYKQPIQNIKTHKDYVFIGLCLLVFVLLRTYYAYRIAYKINLDFHLNTLLYVVTYSYVLYHALPTLYCVKENTKMILVYCIQRKNVQKIGLAVLFLLATIAFKKYLTQYPQMQSPTKTYFLTSVLGIGYHGATWILQFFSGFGMIAILLYFMLSRVAKTILSCSLGLYLLWLIAILINLHKESRVIMDIYAFVILSVVLTLEKYHRYFNKVSDFLVVLLINIGMSKFYISIEHSALIWHSVEKIWIPKNYALSTYLMDDAQYWMLIVLFIVCTGISRLSLFRFYGRLDK
ncbi:MAG: hypothetical protein RML94_09955 [Bacteroidia bacterium]|nr:hypothetical protein [Bacteroidia bacterium]